MIKKIFNLYLLNGLVFHSLISMLILSSIFFIFKIFDIFSDPQFFNASSFELFQLSILNLPTIFYQLTASSVLIGTIFFISKIHEENEFIAFFSAGISKESLAKKLFLISLFFSSILTTLGEFTMPYAEESIVKFKSHLTGNTLEDRYYGNYWVKEKNNVIKFYSDDKMQEPKYIKFFAFDDKQNLKEFITATLSVDNKISDILDFLKIELIDDQIKFTNSQSRELQYQIDKDINNQEVTYRHSKTMSFIDLIRKIRNIKGYDYDKKKYEVEILSRLTKPVTISILLLLITPNLLIFSRTRSISSNLFKAIFLTLLMNFLINLIESMALRFELNHFILIVLPTMILLSLGLLKVNKRSN